MAIGEGTDRGLADAQRHSWNLSNNPDFIPGEDPEPAMEHGIPEAIDNMTDPESIRENVEKLCRCDCTSVKVTLELSDADDEAEILKGIQNRSKRFGTWNGDNISKSFSCSGSGPYTFP
jgi:hypothetical protein